MRDSSISKFFEKTLKERLSAVADFSDLFQFRWASVYVYVHLLDIYLVVDDDINNGPYNDL